MKRTSLKHNNASRPKALFGADGAISAAATITAALMQTAATAKASKEQAKAMTENAKTQAQSISQQTANSNELQKESIDFTRAQNQETHQQQQDIQTTLQMLAGQQNVNDRLEASKMQVKYGGKPRKLKEIEPIFYGAAKKPFTVTDGGGVIPLNVDNNGYGLYEIYGNDHDHSHKASGGKRKTGVGFKFPDGSVVEGEGNQNTSNGEKLLVTPNDAMFISKHSIGGFNPAKAVDKGMNPIDAFNYQENLKAIMGINNDGSKKRNSLKHIALMGTNIPMNNSINIANQSAILGDTAATGAYGAKQNNIIAKHGTHIKLKNGGRIQADDGFFKQHSGAMYNAAGNLAGAAISSIGNGIASRRLGRAYNKAADILVNGYRQMHGIDINSINREDFAAPHTMATIRSPKVNVAPQLERLRRNAVAERKLVDNNTLSSAAQQQKLAGINDRMYQRSGEVYADQANREEQIKQYNADAITRTAQANADRDIQANKDYTGVRVGVMQYNNDIENAKIAGIAQARADSLTQGANVRNQAFINGANSIGNAIQASAQSIGNSINAQEVAKNNIANTMLGAERGSQVTYLISNPNKPGNRDMAENLITALENSSNPDDIRYREQLKRAYNIRPKYTKHLQSYIPSIRNNTPTGLAMVPTLR